MTILKHNNPIMAFDNFVYFKTKFYKQEGHMYNLEINNTNYTIDSRTRYFYDYYIKKFGYDYIEKKVSDIKDVELRKELVNFLSYSKVYEKDAEYNLQSFCEESSIPFDQIIEIKSVCLFEDVFELCELLSRIKSNKRYNELAAVAIAYFFYDGVSDDTAENFWYYITRHLCNEMGTELGIKKSTQIYARANDILKETDIIIIPQYDDFPKTLVDVQDKDFVDTYAEEFANRQIIGYNHIHIGKQIFNKEYMQLFPLYAYYRKKIGRNFFDENKISDEDFIKQFKLFDYIFVNYYNEECHRFKDYLQMQGCEFLYDKLSSYIPVSYYTIDCFIRKNYDRNVDYSMERYAALLLTYWLYDQEDLSYSDSLYVHNILHMSLSKADNYPSHPEIYVKDFVSRIANTIIKEANNFGKILNLPLIPQVQTLDEEFKESGTFLLPWKYVTFNNGYLLLSHPLSDGKSSTRPYRLELKSSKYAYNAIKLYFSSSVPLFKVHSINKQITKVENVKNFDLEKYVESIIYRSSKRKKIEIHRREHLGESSNYKSYTLSELKQDPLIKKSYYLNELCKMHLQHYKVYQCCELRSNATSSTTESIFCFVVKECHDQLILAIENTLDSRSTIVFFIKKTLLLEAVSVIGQFFSSDEVNKRQSLQWNDVDFNDVSIIKYKRIIHSSIYDWKHAMNLLLKC